MLHLINQRYDIVTTTPDRSVPSSPSLSPAVVTHTVATSSKPQRNSWSASSVDLTELSKLLANENKNNNKNTPTTPKKNANARPRSQLFQSSKPPSPTLSTSSAEPTFCTNSNAVPILLTTSQQQPRPILSHRPASTCSTPSQFVFKKPEYDERYHQTHFHRQSSSQSLHNPNSDRKDLFLAWSDLRRFFVNTQQQQQQQYTPSSPTGSTHSHEESNPTKPGTFANQFRQDIGGKYGTWGKVYINVYIFSLQAH